MRRLVVAALLALAFAAGIAPAAAGARTRLDARIDALTTHTLLTRDASSLVDPLRQRRARTIADLQHVASAGWGIAQILAFWWLWRSGTGARIRDWMRRRTTSRTAHRAVFGAVLGALAPLSALPFAFVGYRVAFNAGVTDETVPRWFVDYAGRVAIDAVLGALLVVLVLGLVERVRIWYVVLVVIFYGGALGAVALAPLVPLGVPQKATPKAVSAMANGLAQTLDMRRAPVVVLATSRHSNAMTSRAAGIAATSRVVVGDLLLFHMTVPELRTVLARVLVHVRYGDPARQTLLGVTLFVLSAAIAVLLSDRVGFRRDDDALSRLALVGTFLGAVLLVTYPIYTAYGRDLETRADEVSLAATGDRPSTVRALVRLADDDLIPLCDRRSVRWYFDDRPPLGGRIARAAGTADPCPGGGPATATPPPF